LSSRAIVNRVLASIFALLFSLSLALISHPLQSDGNPLGCEVSAECIGRIPYYEPLVLINPVKGCSAAAIWSRWGDSRDNGKRVHRGMDIFAKRGTPVIAPIDGVITRVGWNVLGGKVVWLSSRKAQHSFYFAHLAETKVCQGDTVRMGHQLGTVGNTGNARLTSPHLHFGIYALNTKHAMNRDIIWNSGTPEGDALRIAVR
jgi:murein DD-endopeptidase MepM/ murein hydrolase activator NlpD